ncbi:lytic transglycosylase domain-containing protein [Leucobacter sp. OH1287]|uniref:lytic transglycosylase domain-containing protein n=1 Tax=Leucobacter sp. OH1287 TaxID=2491049 RepID=UPI001F47F09C|nr:lytic murein transglycosylase [Leucobacter sp. OH1287]
MTGQGGQGGRGGSRSRRLAWFGVAALALAALLLLGAAVLRPWAVGPGGQSGAAAEEIGGGGSARDAKTARSGGDSPVRVPVPGAEDDAEGAGGGSAGAGSGKLTGIAAKPSSAWVNSTAEKTGIPARVLAAYAGAELAVKRETPACGLDWATLAGIGEVESAHGTLAGGEIRSNGKQQPAIFGIPLNGVTTEHIPDTDGGSLDGDPQFDRALGPMQLIPETWQRFAADGNLDGKTDPQQIDDAALTAARYLCTDGHDLRTPAGWIQAVADYNNTADYNNRVAEAANSYRQRAAA